MEKELSAMKSFLKEFNEEIQSPTSEDIPHRVVNYSLDLEDITGQVIDWILNYLENKKCPYPLALAIAKETAHQVSASFAEVACNATEEELEKFSNSTKLFNEALSKLPSICTSFLNQSNLDSLCATKYRTSVFAIKNKRRKMEDRHVVHHDLNALLDLKDAPYQSYYAIFDGHSGVDAASYASAQLHVNVAKHPEFLTDTQKAIVEGYQITDLNFLNKCNKGNIKSGCTAVTALIRENVLYLSWLGDSLAVLVKEGVPQSLTNPHKPNREDERQRIENLGGHVTHMGTWRVNSLLAITRAIGDPDQKPFIISEPEVTVINLDGNEDFLILGCDGLWDGMSPEDVTSVLYHYLADSSPDEPSDAVAAKLVHQSKLQGSEDNITVIVIFLRDANVIKENSSKFMANSSLPIQNQDFLSMNGNMKSPPSDVPFNKPTVLELNSASSKKLKNTANVMSSTGLESAFHYQYFENSVEASHVSPDSSTGSNPNTFLSHQNASAACFAPEATALSELPTPPIDDMLASQQYDNFYSTDLYKEFSNSMQAAQNLQATDISSTADLISGSSEQELIDPVLSQTVDVVASVKNMSLINIEENTKIVKTGSISPDEAVDIASTLVSTAVETAVKCLSSSESPDIAPAQSPIKLNPYAKPFVMKSFFSSEDTIQNTAEGNNLSIVEADSQLSAEAEILEHIAEKTPEVCSESPKNIDAEQFIENIHASNNKNTEQQIEVVSQSVKDNLETQVPPFNCENQLATSILDVEVSSNTATKPLVDQDANVTFIDHGSSEPNYQSFEVQSSSVDQLLQGDITNDQIVDYGSSNVVESITSHSITSPEKLSSPVLEIGNEGNMVKMNTQEFVSEASTLEDVSSSLSHEIENLNLNAGSSSFGENLITNEAFDQLATPVEVANIDLGIISSMPVEVKDNEQELIEVNTPLVESSKESNLLEFNQNVLDEVSVDLDHANKNEESKANVTDHIVAAIENEKYVIPDSTVLLEGIAKEPISIISVSNELISAEAEVPSDPSVEDSHLEPVAVDLKSLPEGIPEAEGVTEDVDSDSEKDGGWSYMKGNTVTGSKSKTGQKASKIKPNDKTSTASKLKKDVPVTSSDVKSRARSTTTTDKTKIASTDKTKSISADKNKNAAVSDKIKSPAVLDKTKTATVTDRSKKTTTESKLDVKSRNLKSSTLSTATKTTMKVTTTSLKKEIVEIPKSSISKPTRPTTLLRSTGPTGKPPSTTADRVTVLSKTAAKPTGSLPVKARVNVAVSENKTAIKTSSTTLSKGMPSTQSKPSSSVRSAPSRPATTLPSRTTGVPKSAPTLKSATDSKPKQLTNTVARKPMSTVLKKPDVKEVKDSVNKQILAKKSTTVNKVESSCSSTASRRVAPISKPALSKTSSATTKSEPSKKTVPKAPPSKLAAKSASLKPSHVVSVDKKKQDVQSKTDQEKNNINIEIDQKTVVEAAQLAEEKFILETSDKEIIVKEDSENSSEIKQEVIVENGSLSDSATPVEEKVAPPVECTSDSL